MIHIICQKCTVGLRISPGEPGETESLYGPSSDWWPDNYPCFVCGKKAQLLETVTPGETKWEAMHFHDVTPKEAYAAMNGLGLPAERECSAEAVRQLLSGARIKRAKVKQIQHDHRCVIDYLELEDETKVYIAAAPMGAVVYRVAPKHSYVAEVEREQREG